jgi:hypothetical protein
MYTPIAVPNATAKMMEMGHQGFHEVKEEERGLEYMVSGSSALRQSFASLPEEGRKPTARISFSAPGLPC